MFYVGTSTVGSPVMIVSSVASASSTSLPQARTASTPFTANLRPVNMIGLSSRGCPKGQKMIRDVCQGELDRARLFKQRITQLN